MDFPYISPPSIPVLKKALEMLFLLGALNKVSAIKDLNRSLFGSAEQFAKLCDFATLLMDVLGDLVFSDNAERKSLVAVEFHM